MHTVLCSQPNIHNAKTRADEPDNFLAALAPASASGFFPSTPAPNFFPKRLRLLVFFLKQLWLRLQEAKDKWLSKQNIFSPQTT